MVLSVEVPNQKDVVITGEFDSEIIPEITANFHGEFKTHPKYGYQFRAFSCEPTYNEKNLDSIKLFLSTITKWVGHERADAIVNHFKQDTIKILDEEPQRLIEVEGIGDISTGNLIEAWKEGKKKWEESKEIYSFKSFLSSLGLREGRIKRVINYLGGSRESEDTIRQNPYTLIEVEGFGFSITDYIAKRLGIKEDAPERLRAFIIYALKVLCNSYGHLFFTKEELIASINQYLRENDTNFIGKNALSWDEIESSINSLIKDGIIVFDRGCIYTKQNYLYESVSASVLSSIINQKSDFIMLDRPSIDEFIELFEKENQITLSAEQREALYCFSEKKVFIITGSPGTGKTTILKAIVEITQKIGLSLTPLTPTGISAKKLATTINYPSYTVHRRLGFRGNTWMYNETNPYKTDVVVVDETSMLDQEVLYRLLISLEKRTHIIFVGDHNQLPSVGAGNVLRDLIDCGKIPVVRLEQIFRQKEASDIIQIAHMVKNGQNCLDNLGKDPTDDVFFIRLTDVSEIEKYIVALAGKFKNEKRIFQIITPRNTGPLSIETLNTTLQSVLNPPNVLLAEIKVGKFIVRRGDRIIVIKNDYENDIYNGDIGKVIGITGGKITVKIDDELVVDIGVEEAEEKLKLAYAITVHKAQGQEYPTIIMPFIRQHGLNMLQRNLLYTGITRAKEKVILLGHGAAIEKAIGNATVTKRNTLLKERIIESLTT